MCMWCLIFLFSAHSLLYSYRLWRSPYSKKRGGRFGATTRSQTGCDSRASPTRRPRWARAMSQRLATCFEQPPQTPRFAKEQRQQMQHPETHEKGRCIFARTIYPVKHVSRQKTVSHIALQDTDSGLPPIRTRDGERPP